MFHPIRGRIMDVVGPLLAAADAVMREAALFAAAGFLILGASDLVLDLIWVGVALRRRRMPARSADDLRLAGPDAPGPIAVFVPAWDEAPVIGSMLVAALGAFGPGDYCIYVGCYPNDPATIAAVRAVDDPRVRLVIGPVPGPTTKADCLNRLWETMLEDETVHGRQVKAVVLHDAEDVVHSAELRLFDRLIETAEMVQLPVLPLIDRGSRWVSGHYADEFAESHGKDLVVRAALGAAVPSAGVGCAFARSALGEIAARSGGLPFDAASFTEDYELGLRIGRAGGRTVFARIPAAPGRPPVSTREYFPDRIGPAVAQKARWMTGIALSGWDRLGWSGGAAERWMRFRDRQSVLAALLLFSGYLAASLWALLVVGRAATGFTPAPLSSPLTVLMAVDTALLGWRLAMRFGFVARAYGWREGLRSIPRALVGNFIAMLAAAAALSRYNELRRTGNARWHKTDHCFPLQVPAE
jgi:adsorption protein B